MPTYEYHCPACGATYDLRQSFSAETTHTCEECGKGIAKRVLHAPPIVFKGSGWYVTDSRGKSSTLNGESSSSDGDSDSSSTDSSSKSTPVKETKSESKGNDSTAAAAS